MPGQMSDVALRDPRVEQVDAAIAENFRVKLQDGVLATSLRRCVPHNQRRTRDL